MENSVRNLQYGPKTRLKRGILFSQHGLRPSIFSGPASIDGERVGGSGIPYLWDWSPEPTNIPAFVLISYQYIKIVKRLIPNTWNYLEKEYYIPKKGISGLRQTVQPFFLYQKISISVQGQERNLLKYSKKASYHFLSRFPPQFFFIPSSTILIFSLLILQFPPPQF